jgi:hypothetical protein
MGMEKLARDVEELLSSEPGAATAEEVAPAGTGVFRQEGDVWAIGYGGELFRLKDAKGLRYMAHLLAQPGREVHVTELVTSAADDGSPPRAPAISSPSEEGLSVKDLGDAGDVLDAKAKAEYRSRLEDLREELEEAERFNDPERAARAQWEIDMLADQLSAAVGLGGRSRKAASAAERARVNVRNSITSSLKAIRQHDEALWRHLSNAIRTGTFCAYEPETEVTWQL